MKCANCGNEDPRMLFEEDNGAIIYCSKCCHRTRTSDGQDDLVECPYCHRLRDRKALYCMWCNCAWESTPKPSPKLSRELNESLRDFDETLTPANIRYWKVRPKK